MKGKAQYGLPPVSTSVDQVLFTLKILLTFYKTSNPNEEVNGTEPSPSVCVPWLMLIIYPNLGPIL
jgi:hypothetical protein